MRNGSMMVLANMEVPSMVHVDYRPCSRICAESAVIGVTGRGTAEKAVLRMCAAAPRGAPGRSLRGFLPAYMLDGKINCARQFAAGPVQGVKTRAAAGVLARH